MGLIRLLLALFVVQAHAGTIIPGLPALSGQESVRLFYVISGFYMALILNRKYSGPGGTRTFYINRVLRLWPPYLVVAAITVLVYLTIGKVRTFGLDISLDQFVAASLLWLVVERPIDRYRQGLAGRKIASPDGPASAYALASANQQST